ncbi:MAG: pyridoxal phosphate-dependent aminotransferase [Anaerovibrio sp.]|uniref:MalY/PatB family protein n=1 Tax=Anaerovibrio sp. TaxID=1872532 RepID=UPI0025D86597|nr:MalY/PatB family protein [Anaerovibrio sp.]MCR5175959.1 pyridoxal phosphate-dependent aminotransferase [Anaerovibrio sp.]
MNYDFDKVINRRNTNSLKWDVAENELPMWVADMDFPTAAPIMEAINKKLQIGALGYSIIPEEWNEAYVNWWKQYHNFDMSPDWLIFSTGVLSALGCAVRKLTTPGEKVLIQTPVYNNFFNSIINNGRFVVESPLHYDGGTYSMDYEQLDKDLSDPQVRMMILCNPQNPSGRIWSPEELARVGELCYRHHVIVISDEIHCDLTDPEKSYTPFASVNDICRNNSVSLIAPTKTFNIAGLNTAAVMVPDSLLHHKMWREMNTIEAAEPNFIAVEAAVAAFNNGREWLEQLRDYIYNNKMVCKEYIEKNISPIYMVPSEATYLLWLDCSRFCEDSVELAEFIRNYSGLFLSEGAEYGKAGECFLRLNIACPREVLMDGLQRLGKSIRAYIDR